MTLFHDREQAATELAEVLAARGYASPVVLGIPRGGVPMAARIALRIGGEPGLVVARKLRAPSQPELAIGAVAPDGSVYVDSRLAAAAGADRRYLAEETARQLVDARAREARFDGARGPRLEGRIVIVVDDGIATGSTAFAALRAVRASGAARVVMAVPVGPPGTIAALATEADEIICPHVESDFYAVGQFYRDFPPVTDDEVARIVAEWRARGGAAIRRSAFVTRPGVRLAARFSAPAAGHPAPCVLFVHGLGSGKDSPRNVAIAERLLDAGFATVLFDLSGHGESSEAPGSIDAFAADTAAVASWAAGQPEVDAARMVLAGSSLGALVALQAVRGGLVSPRALVLRAPPLEPGDLEGLQAEALVLAGGRDSLLPQIRRELAGKSGFTFEVIEGAGHLFEEPGTLERAIGVTVDWLGAHILSAIDPTP